MKQVQKIADVLNGSSYIDCYVSTDGSEVASILHKLGYNIQPKRPTIPKIEEEYFELKRQPRTVSLRHKTGLKIDCTDVLLSDILQKRKDIGFDTMSYFRIEVRGNHIERELVSILTALDTERQNIAFVNDRYSRAFVKLSEFYRR